MKFFQIFILLISSIPIMLLFMIAVPFALIGVIGTGLMGFASRFLTSISNDIEKLSRSF